MPSKSLYTCALFLALGTAGSSAQAPAHLTGTVLDPARAPIPDARVLITGLVAVTDDSGKFVLVLPAGDVHLQIEKTGFEPYSHDLRIQPGETRLDPIILTPETVHTTVSVHENIGYRTPVVSSATKDATPLLDIPQTIQAIPQTLIEEQAALSLNDVLANVAGVSPSLGEGRRDHMLIRGFSAVNDQYLDGVRDDALYYRDLSDIESVEVLEGPAAVLFGRGSSGGLVNRITRKPDPERPLGEVKLIAGSYGEKRLEFDASQPWLDGKLDGRLTGAYEDAGSFRDFARLNRYTFAPSLLWKPTDRTDFLAHFGYLNDRRVPDRGIPSFNGAPVDVPAGEYYGYEYGDHIRSRNDTLSFTANHRFSDQWSIHDSFHQADYGTDFSNTYPSGASLVNNQILVARGQYNGSFAQQNVFNQSEANGRFVWLGITHTILAGLELGHQTYNNTQFTGSAGSVAPFNPVLTEPLYSLAPGTMNQFRAVIAGAYFQDQIAWRRWRLVLGARHDTFNQRQISLLPGITPLSRTDQAWSPRAGLVYTLTSNASLYASFSKTFDPSGESLALAANNSQLAPERTRNYEIGAKTNVFHNRITATAALFRLNRDNIKTTDPNNPTQLIEVGAQRTDGLELSLAGHIWRGWNVTGGYAFFDPLIVKSNSLQNGVALQGNVPGIVAKRNGNLWTTYFWTNGFGIGAGVYQTSRRFAANDDLAVLPGFVRFDAALYYRRGRWQGSFNIRNLLNRSYYETAQTDSQIFPGEPVNGLLTLIYRW